MPYMYCNQEGCNETVKLPANYCAKHQPTTLPDPLSDSLPDPEPEPFNVEQPTDKIVVKTKKTTK